MITITRAQYDALLALASASDPSAAYQLQKAIDATNSITRYILNIRWQEMGGTPPPRINLSTTGWPPTQTYRLELERPIERADVDVALKQAATNPVDVHVTSDPAGKVGWYELDAYSFT